MNQTEHNEALSADTSRTAKKNKTFNILAFIVCLLSAFIIWVFVMNTQNSSYTKTFSIPVDVRNEEKLLSDTGLTIFEIDSKKQTSITIQGKKADVQKCSEKDFSAYIDVLSVEDKGTYPVSVVIETSNNLVSVIAVEPKTINVYADSQKEKLFAYIPYCDNDDKYKFEVVTPTHISISGPSEYIEKIASVKVKVPVNDTCTEGQIIESSNIELYGKNGDILPHTYMTIATESVSVVVKTINE